MAHVVLKQSNDLQSKSQSPYNFPLKIWCAQTPVNISYHPLPHSIYSKHTSPLSVPQPYKCTAQLRPLLLLFPLPGRLFPQKIIMAPSLTFFRPLLKRHLQDLPYPPCLKLQPPVPFTHTDCFPHLLYWWLLLIAINIDCLSSLLFSSLVYSELHKSRDFCPFPSLLHP